MDNVIRREGLWDAPKREYREKPILLDVTHADPQAQVHLRGGSADHDGSAASTSEARKRQHYARPGHVSFDVQNDKLANLAVESVGRLGVEGSSFITSWKLAYTSRGEGGRAHGKEGGGERTPTPNRLGNYTGRHFEEDVAVQAPA